jgi:predicted O-methyltransferase YrrM
LEAEAVLREIEKMAPGHFLPIIGAVKGKYLAETVKNTMAGKVLEVGTLVGYSAILIAINLPEDGQIDTIEINPRSAEMAQENIRKANLSHKVKIHIGDAKKIIAGMHEQFDMIFLDAEKKEYLEYLKLSERMLKTNGVVFADNVKMFAAQMGDFLDYVRSSGRYRSRFVDVGYDGVEISTKLF